MVRWCLSAVCLFWLLLGSAYARTGIICNGSPVEITVAVAYSEGAVYRSHGWYLLAPGACQRFTLENEHFYYHAQANSRLAQWMNGGKSMVWQGTTHMCVHPHQAFSIQSSGPCDTTHGFRHVVLTGAEHTVPLIVAQQPDVALQNAPLMAQDMQGVMEWEAMMIQRRRAGDRVSPFQLGVGIRPAARGVEITYVQTGMPADIEGILPGDVFLRLGGHELSPTRSLNAILASLPHDRHEPLAVTVLRQGVELQGWLSPVFMPSLHPLFRLGGGGDALLSSMINAAGFGLGNEIACGATYLLIEALNWAGGQTNAPDTAGAVRRAAQCAREENYRLALYRILYEESTNAGEWAAMLIPGGGTARAAIPRGRALSLAAKSRTVPRTTLRPSGSFRR